MAVPETNLQSWPQRYRRLLAESGLNGDEELAAALRPVNARPPAVFSLAHCLQQPDLLHIYTNTRQRELLHPQHHSATAKAFQAGTSALTLAPAEFFKRFVQRCFGKMVNVVTQGLLGETENHLKHLLTAIACVVKGFQVIFADIPTLACSLPPA